jgi:hypothetical protein
MVGPTKTTVGYDKQIFQNVIETAQGGFTLDDTVAVTAALEVKSGTAIGFDATTRKAKVAKMGVLQANATNTATTYRVTKGHTLAVGMSIILAGGTARAITAVDTSNGAYDEFTVGTTIGVAGTAGDVLYVNDIGATAPNGLVLDAFTAAQTADIAVVIRGTVYENRIPPVAASVKLLMPNIIFSKSF